MATVLDREMYSEADAAHLLNVNPKTLHYWLEGEHRGDKIYKPIIRFESIRRRTVTWAEFIEAGWLREYRQARVPMDQLRRFIDLLRGHFGVPYPLADRRPLVSGRELVYDAQTAAQLGAEFCLVAVSNDQLILTPPGHNFVRRVEWVGDTPVRYRPDPNEESSVRVDPDIRFGRPSVQGISTEAIWEQTEAGEDAEALARVYQLDETDVRWALAYENARRAAA